MADPFLPFGLYLGYFDHSTAVRQNVGGKFLLANGQNIRALIQDRCDKLRPPNTREEFFRPRFASCFGFSDDIAFSFIDSLSDALNIFSGVPQQQNFVVATPFAPEYFNSVDPHKRLVNPLDWIPSTFNPNAETGYLPLVVVSHLKLSGVFTLACGIYAQVSAASLIVKTINDTIEEITRLHSPASTAAEGSSPYGKLFPEQSEGSGPSLKLSLLSSVASEDLTLVVFCNNYSLAVSALAAVRCLTIGELIRHAEQNNEDLSRVLKNCTISPGNGGEPFIKEKGSSVDSPDGFLKRFTLLASTAASRDSNDVIDESAAIGELDTHGIPNKLYNNHLLSASYTTLGFFSDVANVHELLSRVEGYASIQAHADINPGHEADVDSSIDKKWRNFIATKNVQIEEVPRSTFRFVLPGKHDLSRHFDNKTTVACAPMRSFLEFLSSLFDNGDQKAIESGFQDLNTDLVIPVPAFSDLDHSPLKKLLEPPIEAEKHVNVMLALDNISNYVRRYFLLDMPDTLEQLLKDNQFEESVRIAAQRLFSQYAASIGDPLFFDSVVDLSGVFLTVFDILRFLPASRKGESDVAAKLHAIQSQEFLMEAINALNQAFLLRLGRSSAKKEDRIGELQGSVTGLLCAADAVLKSSLGFWRRVQFPDDVQFVGNRRLVTGIIEPVLRQRPTARPISVGPYQVALIRVDSFHILKPDGLPRVIHEVAHLYFENFIADKLGLAIEAWYPNENHPNRRLIETYYTEASEIFSDFMTGMLVFGEDYEAFAKNQMGLTDKLKGELCVKEADDFESIIIASIQLKYRAFVVTVLLEALCKNADFDGLDIGAISFQAFLQKYDPCNESPFASGEILKELAREIANSAGFYIKNIFNLIGPELYSASNVYNMRNEAGSGASNVEFAACLKSLAHAGTAFGLVERFQVDEGVIVRALLKNYLVMSEANALDADHRRLNYCLVNMTMKSLWHISTRQRRRRLGELIDLSLAQQM